MLMLSAVSVTPSEPIPGESSGPTATEIVRHSPLIYRICGFKFEIYGEVSCRCLFAVSLISEAPVFVSRALLAAPLGVASDSPPIVALLIQMIHGNCYGVFGLLIFTSIAQRSPRDLEVGALASPEINLTISTAFP